MAEAALIDGKAFAASLRERVGTGVAELTASTGIRPGLATILVGDDPASEVYVRSKSRVAAELGMASFDHRLPGTTAFVVELPPGPVTGKRSARFAQAVLALAR